MKMKVPLVRIEPGKLLEFSGENHLKLRPTSEDIDYIESMADSDSTEKYKGLKDKLLGTFTQAAYCDFV